MGPCGYGAGKKRRLRYDREDCRGKYKNPCNHIPPMGLCYHHVYHRSLNRRTHPTYIAKYMKRTGPSPVHRSALQFLTKIRCLSTSQREATPPPPNTTVEPCPSL